jgi:hypothetical protein
LLTGATSNAGSVVIVNNFLTNELYYYIKVTAAIPSGTLSLGGVRNPTDFSPGLILKLVVWKGMKDKTSITFPITSDFNNAGIYG